MFNQRVQAISLQLDEVANIQELSQGIQAKSINEASQNIRNSFELKLRSVTPRKSEIQAMIEPNNPRYSV